MSRPSNGLELAGKHRAIVEDNDDPIKLGRLKVRIQAAYGAQPLEKLPWAWPCLPYGGMPQTGLFAIPDIGSGVWVEFLWKDGRPDTTYPVWTGTWLAEDETPIEAIGPKDPVPGDEKVVSKQVYRYKVFKTTAGHSITLCDLPGKESVTIEHGTKGAIIHMDKEGNISICGPKKIAIDAGEELLLRAPHIRQERDEGSAGRYDDVDRS